MATARPVTQWASVVALVAASGCAGNGGTEIELPMSAGAPEEVEAVSRETLAHDLEATVLDIYGHLTLGNFGAYRDALAADQPVVLIGVTPEDVVIGPRPAAAGRDRRLYRTRAPTLLSKNLDVHLSGDGSTGWTFDELSYRVAYDGRQASIPIRNTTMFVRDFDRWVLAMEHQSHPMAIDDLRALAAAQRLEPPRRFASRHRVAPAAELVRLVGLVHNAEPGDPERRIAAGGQTLVLLPDREHELRGKEAAEAPPLAALFGPGTTVGVRDYRVSMAKNGVVAWMAANLVVRTVINDDRVDIGLRGTYVFQAGPGGWELAQMHISAPVSEIILSRRLFATP